MGVHRRPGPGRDPVALVDLRDFTSTFQVRFDECAQDGAVRAPALLRYTIETAFAHSAHEGFPLAWYDARGLYWLVRRAQLDLIRSVPYGTLVSATTHVVGFRRIWARRRNMVRDGTGDDLGEIVMDWIFTDREGNPARVVPEMERAFPGPDEPFRVERLDLGEPPAAGIKRDYAVPGYQIDPRGHMNTAAYLDVFEDALLASGVDAQRRPVTYDLEFLRQVRPGEILSGSLWREAEVWKMVVTTRDEVPVARARRSVR